MSKPALPTKEQIEELLRLRMVCHIHGGRENSVAYTHLLNDLADGLIRAAQERERLEAELASVRKAYADSIEARYLASRNYTKGDC